MATSDYNIVITVTNGQAISATDAITKALKEVSNAANRISSDIQGTGDKIAKAMRTANVEARNNAKALSESSKKAKDLAVQNRILSKSFGTLAAALSVRSLKKTVDTYTSMQNKIKALSGEGANYAAIQEQLYEISQRSRTSLEGTTQLYSRLVIAQNQLGASTQDLMRFTEGVGKALQISGTSAFTQRGVLLQLSQAVGTNVVRAEEFNSILEGGIRIAQAAADGIAGYDGNISKLRKAVVDGKISSEEFFNAILSQIPKLEREFAQTIPTIDQAIVMLNNSWTVWIGKLNETFGISNMVTTAIIDISRNMEALAISVGVVTTAVVALKAATLSVGKIMSWITGPMGKAAIAIAGVVAGYTLLRESRDNDTIAVETATKGIDQLVDSYNEEMILTEKTAKRLLDNTKARMADIEALKAEQIAKQAALKAEAEYYKKKKDEGVFTASDAKGVKKVADEWNRYAERIKELDGDLEKAAKFLKVIEKAQKEAVKAAKEAVDDDFAKKRKETIEDLKDELRFSGLVNGQLKVYNTLKKAGFEGKDITINQGKVTGASVFSEEAQAIVDMQNAINVGAVNRSLNNELEMLGKTEIQQEVINRVREAGLVIDENLISSEGKISEAYAKSNSQAMLAAEIAKKVVEVHGEQAVAYREFEKELKEQQNVWDGYKDTALSALSATEDAIIEFAKTGKFSFKDLAASILEDLARVIIRAQLAKAAMAMLGGFSDGGFVGGFANGGIIHGPGSGTSDSIPARLSNGEFVVNAKSASRYRGVLEAINANRFATGGSVGGGSYDGGTSIQIIDQRGANAAPVETSTSTGPDGRKFIEVMVRDTVKQGFARGSYDGAMKTSYGLRRVGYNR